MKFYYGYDNDHYINVTDKVFDKFVFDLGIFIPSGDENRAAVFGDPYPGHLKHVLVVDAFGIMHKFHHSKDISIQINSISKQLALINSPREWYANEGKNIEKADDRLQQLHKHIECNYGHIGDEYPEQLLAMKFIRPDNKILEIGGNIGRNTMIMGCILNDPKNMVTLESDPKNAKLLLENLKTNNIDSYVEASALSQSRLIQKDWITMPLSDNHIPEGWGEVSTITFDDLNKKYNIKFDTLVADCEGALFHILKDDPSILTDINMVILENDFLDIAEKEFVNQVFGMQGLKCIYAESGGWGPCYNFFYEVWKKD